MEEVISKLIEVDKAARKRVSKAKKQSLKAGELLEEKKLSLAEENENKFKASLESIRHGQEEIIQKQKELIEADTQTKLEKLEQKYNENKDNWIQTIYNSITE